MSKEAKPPAENKEPKKVVIENSPPIFSLQKELEKFKIPVPLTELLKQPAYQSQVTSFMLPPEAPILIEVSTSKKRDPWLFLAHMLRR